MDSVMLLRLSAGTGAAVFILLISTSLACVPEALPPLEDDHRDREYTDELAQIIVPAYQFTCRGRVTSWSACVEPGGGRERFLIHFQVWRSTGGGCYTLVGLNIPPERLAPENHCVKFKVPAGDEIEVMPGDALGFYVNRYRVPKSGESDHLEDPPGGGIQLNSDWPASTQILSVVRPPATVGSELCSAQNGGELLQFPVGAPVLTATVDPIQLPTTPNPTHSPALTTSSDELRILETPTSRPSSAHSTELPFLTPPPSITPSSSLLHTSPSTPPSLNSSTETTSYMYVSTLNSTTTEITHTSSHATALGASSIAVTSSPPVIVTSAGKGSFPPLFIAGLAIAGVLVVAILILAIALVMLCLSKQKSKSEEGTEQPAKEEDSDMEYCEAYVLNSNANNKAYLLKEGMVWNTAYHKCTLEGSTRDGPTVKGSQNKQHFTIQERKENLSEVNESKSSPCIVHKYINVNIASHDYNDYEEVY